MSSQPRTYPSHGTDRDDEYPTETFRSVAEYPAAERGSVPERDGDRDPRDPGPAASDDGPPTQEMRTLRPGAEPPAAATSLFEAYTGADDEHDTAVFARFRDDDPDPRPAADPESDDEPHTEQFAAYRDDTAPPTPAVDPRLTGANPAVDPRATGANPVAGRLPTGGMPPIPPVVPPVPPIPPLPSRLPGGRPGVARTGQQPAAPFVGQPPVAAGPDGTGPDGAGPDPADNRTDPADTTGTADASADASAEDADPTLDKRAARQAEKDAKAEAKAAAKAEKLAAKQERKAIRRGEAVDPDDDPASSDPVGTDPASADPAGADPGTAGAVAAGAVAAGAVVAGAAAVRSAGTAEPDQETTGEIVAAAPAERPAETTAPAPVEAEAAPAEPPVEEDEEPDAAAGRRKAPVLVVIALLLVAAAGAGAAVWFKGHTVETGKQRPSSNLAMLDKSATAEAVEQVSRAVEAIYSYDAASLDADEAKALEMINGSYASEFKQNFAAVRALPPGQRASLSSKVVSAGVITLTERRASLLVMLDQVGRQADKPEPVKAAVRLSVTAQRVDGQWKVSGVNQK